MISIEQRLIREAKELIAADLTAAHEALGNGSQLTDVDAATSGMRCARLVGQISGLKKALEHIDSAWREINGKGPRANKGDQ